MILDAVEKEEKIHNVQVVIDSLATDILDIDLSHINAQSVVNRDKVQIQNLLEIFDGLLDFVIEEEEEGIQVETCILYSSTKNSIKGYKFQSGDKSLQDIKSMQTYANVQII